MNSNTIVLVVTLVMLIIGGIALLIPAAVLQFGETKNETKNESCGTDCTLCTDQRSCRDTSGCKWDNVMGCSTVHTSPKTVHTSPTTNCPSGWKCSPPTCPTGYTKMTNHVDAFETKDKYCYQGDKSGLAICCQKGWESECHESCARDICEKHPNSTWMDHEYSKPQAGNYACLVKEERHKIVPTSPSHTIVPKDMKECFGGLLSWPQDKLFAVQFPQLSKLQKASKVAQGGCGSKKTGVWCKNLAIGMTSTSVSFPPGKHDNCSWSGEDARYLFPTPEALKREDSASGGIGNILRKFAADQMWTVKNKSFSSNDQKVSELLYQITSNPSTPTPQDLAKSYACDSGDFETSGLVTTKKRISIGIGPQSSPVVQQTSNRITDATTIPIKTSDFFAPSEEKGSWEDGSNWLHIDDCDPDTGSVMVYIPILANTMEQEGGVVQKRPVRLYLTIIPYSVKYIARGTCTSSQYKPAYLPFEPNAWYDYLRTFQLGWLVWKDESIMKAEEIVNKIHRDIPIASGCDECFLTYPQLFQCNIAPPPKPLETCDSNKYYCSYIVGETKHCQVVPAQATQRAPKCYDTVNDCVEDKKGACCQIIPDGQNICV